VPIQFVLLPVFAQVSLTFALCALLVYAHHRGADPEREKRISDSFTNQFEIPVLFFALIPLALLTRQVDHLFVPLEWIFVSSRIGHAFIHVTSNRQPTRGIFWGVGILALVIMWVVFSGRILFPPIIAPV
jgi:hypothetical protein